MDIPQKQDNIVEYLLYMWQIEDILRAYQLDINVVERELISSQNFSEEEKISLREWYEGLILMMQQEDVQEKGHLQINKDIVTKLTDVHSRLLKNPEETTYIELYYKTLPHIVALRAKSEQKDISEIETCATALYGFLLLKLQKREISSDTQLAISQITKMLALLSKEAPSNSPSGGENSLPCGEGWGGANVLVTGANGQLGREIEELTKNGSAIFHFIFTDVDSLDITNTEQVASFVQRNAIQYIINCAAYTAVDKAETEIDEANAINAVGAENIARAAAENNCRLIHISTDYVFDGTVTTPYTETAPTNPISAYGKSKLKGEEAVLEYDKQAVIIRTSWLYSTFGTNFVKTMLRLMREKESLNIIANQRGTPTYATDLAEMILHILDFSEKNEWKPGVYHFSNQGETTWFGFAEKIKELAEIENCTLNPVSTEEYGSVVDRPMYSVLDKSKIEAAFQVVIPKWEDGLERFLARR
jgi:dTDP-4-dehydrorhamnose reductase